MCNLLSNLSVSAQYNKDLDCYADKYGIHGYLVDYQEPHFLEVKQLNFRSTDFLPRYTKIPTIEGMVSYSQAILQHPIGIQMLTNGLIYNFPIGDKKWVKIDNLVEWIKNTALPKCHMNWYFETRPRHCLPQEI